MTENHVSEDDVRNVILQRLRFVREYTERGSRSRELSVSGTHTPEFRRLFAHYVEEEKRLLAALDALTP